MGRVAVLASDFFFNLLVLHRFNERHRVRVVVRSPRHVPHQIAVTLREKIVEVGGADGRVQTTSVILDYSRKVDIGMNHGMVRVLILEVVPRQALLLHLVTLALAGFLVLRHEAFQIG